MGQLATIGYEGHTLESFLALLAAHGIDMVVDVRALPVSRKPGFAKKALALALAQNGMGYVHMPALGTPKAGREAAARGERDRFDAIFAAQLALPEAHAALEDVATLAQRWRIALLCLEREPARCHRSRIADALSPRLAAPVLHLGVGD